MKFGKEFESQMVHEWQEAYMNYINLKALLKEILNFKQQQQQQQPARQVSLKRKISLYRAFSGLTSRISSFKNSPKSKIDEDDDQVILISHLEFDDQGYSGSASVYRTKFLMSSDRGGEYELVFFRRLDDEFNKVIKFYKKKVDEVVKEAEEINKQMNALIALRIKVDDPKVELDAATSPPSISGVNTIERVSGPLDFETGGHMDAIQEVEMSTEIDSEEENAQEITRIRPAADKTTTKIVGFRPTPLELLDHVKINVTPETPVSTLKNVLKVSKSGLLFSKEELKKVEDRMRLVLIEFYHKLRLLKSYCFMNQMAFSKIMKKYDKITGRNASKAYFSMIDKSYLGRSDEVTKLMERVEATFIKHFSNGNRRKGMSFLRTKPKRQKHRTSFFLGFFFGCSLALVTAVLCTIHARNLLNSEGRGQYMDTIFPLYSLFGYIVLHMLMHAGNMYFWRRYRINYPFIFGVKQGTEVGYTEVLLLASALSMLTLAAALSNLEMDMDPRTKTFSAFTELLPLALFVMVIGITFCPFNIIYRSSRFFLLKSAFHCVCAPFYKVTLPDFYLADQLTSQVQALRCLEFYVCYYVWGDYKTRSNQCSKSNVYRGFYIFVAVIPYWARFLQCLRRLIEEKDTMQGLNGLKYMSTIIAVVLRTINDFNDGITWTVLAATSSGTATLASVYWDLVIDWGLLQKDSKNPWLRDKLLVPHKNIYFVAMGVDVMLRFAWMQSVMDIKELPFLHKTALTAIVASLEILRRGIWNFFRLENEHLNNVGKYRAFKSVPLPFFYDDDVDDDDKNA